MSVKLRQFVNFIDPRSGGVVGPLFAGIEVARFIGLERSELARILLVTEADLSNWIAKEPEELPNVAAARLLTLIGCVDPCMQEIFHGDAYEARLWLREPKEELEGFAPVDLMQSEAGLDPICAYLQHRYGAVEAVCH